MALEKELINGKGVKTSYHRIDSISMVDGIKVTVKSYTCLLYTSFKNKHCTEMYGAFFMLKKGV